MTREEFEKTFIAVLGEAVKAGFLHRMVFMADTAEHHVMLTNMGQKSTLHFLLHMAQHAVDGRGDNVVAYNLVTGERHFGEDAEEVFAAGIAASKKGNGRRKQAH